MAGGFSRYLCDPHERQEAAEHAPYMLTRRVTWEQFLRDLEARPDRQWPAKLWCAVGVAPGDHPPCRECGTAAVVRKMEIDQDGTVLLDEGYCVEHSPKGTLRRQGRHALNGWPARCDLCNRPATVHLAESGGPAGTTRHLCDTHAAAEGMLDMAAP